MNRKHLYAVAAAIWGIPGVIITSKGINAYSMQPSDKLWWLLLITAAVLTAFFLMFRRIVDRYCDRIASLNDKVKIWQTFPPRGWILMVFMMSLGIALKHIPGVPTSFTASFYSGLGPMLLLSSGRFFEKYNLRPVLNRFILLTVLAGLLGCSLYARSTSEKQSIDFRSEIKLFSMSRSTDSR